MGTHTDVTHTSHALLSLLLLGSVSLLGSAILAEPVTLRFRLEANALIVSDLVTAITAHDISTILAHIAVLIPRSFFLLVVLLFIYFFFIGVLPLLLLPWCWLRTALFFFVRVVVRLLRFGVIFLTDHLTVFLNDNLSGSTSASPRLNSTSSFHCLSMLLARCDGLLGTTS